MKKQIQSIRFFFLATFLITALTATAHNNVVTATSYCHQAEIQLFDASFSYSWQAVPGAVSYVVDMVNTATQESYSWETVTNSITVFSLPSGTYDLTVMAKFADQSSSIIVEDFVTH